MTITRSIPSLISLCLFIFPVISAPVRAVEPEPDLPEPDTSGIAEESIEYVQKCYDEAKKSPNDAQKVGDYGMILLRISKLNAAAKCFEKLIKMQPDEVRWYYYLGIIKEQLLETKQAAELFRKCHQLEPGYAPALIHLADAIRAENPEQAEKYYLDAQRTSPSDARVYFGLGECLRLRGQTNEAIAQYKRAIGLVPQYADAHGALSRLYLKQGDRINADIHAAAEKKGREPRVVRDPYYIDLMSRGASAEWLLDLANQLILTRDFDLADKFIQRAGSDKRYSDESDKLRGLLAFYRQDFERAAENLSRYLEQIRGDNENRLIYAKSLIQLKRFDDAVIQSNILSKARPDDPELLEFAGYVNTLARRPEAAVVPLQKAIRLEPKRASAFVSLIVAHIAAGSMADALSAYKSAVSLFPGAAELDESLMINLLNLGRVQLDAPSAQSGANERFTPAAIKRFSEVLSRADLTDSADRLANYPITVGAIIERHARNNDFDRAFGAMDRIIDVDEGGHYRNAMSRTVQMLNASSSVTTNTFLIENTRKAATDINLANMMGWIRATSAEKSLRDGTEALRLAEIADKETGHRNPEVLDTLAAAYAESGNFAKAIEVLQTAIDNAGTSTFRSDAFKKRLELYKKQTAYRY